MESAEEWIFTTSTSAIEVADIYNGTEQERDKCNCLVAINSLLYIADIEPCRGTTRNEIGFTPSSLLEGRYVQLLSYCFSSIVLKHSSTQPSIFS